MMMVWMTWKKNKYPEPPAVVQLKNCKDISDSAMISAVSITTKFHRLPRFTRRTQLTAIWNSVCQFLPALHRSWNCTSYEKLSFYALQGIFQAKRFVTPKLAQIQTVQMEIWCNTKKMSQVLVIIIHIRDKPVKSSLLVFLCRITILSALVTNLSLHFLYLSIFSHQYCCLSFCPYMLSMPRSCLKC